MSRITRWCRALLAAAGVTACLVAVPLAHAADAPARYAVLSIIGDRITLVWFRQAIGSNVDQNQRQTVPIKDATLDNLALLAVDDALRARNAKPSATLMTSRDAALLDLQDTMVDRPVDAAPLLAPVGELLRKTQATRLILVSKARDDARFDLLHRTIGSGKVAGLGFYIDQEVRIRLLESGTADAGFIAPYAYFNVSLIDLPSMTVIRSKRVTESALVATAQAKDALNPWDAMTPKQKFDALDELIRAGIQRAMPELLKGE